jgi:hypothetical protein
MKPKNSVETLDATNFAEAFERAGNATDGALSAYRKAVGAKLTTE